MATRARWASWPSQVHGCTKKSHGLRKSRHGRVHAPCALVDRNMPSDCSILRKNMRRTIFRARMPHTEGCQLPMRQLQSLSVSLSVCPSVFLSFCLSVFLSVCLSVGQSVGLCANSICKIPLTFLVCARRIFSCHRIPESAVGRTIPTDLSWYERRTTPHRQRACEAVRGAMATPCSPGVCFLALHLNSSWVSSLPTRASLLCAFDADRVPHAIFQAETRSQRSLRAAAGWLQDALASRVRKRSGASQTPGFGTDKSGHPACHLCVPCGVARGGRRSSGGKPP